MTEQRPLAAVLGTELELRLFNYRDTTPLRAGQVDDEPYGGGAGMVLRVDVVAAALDAVYGSSPDQRVIALTPQGRPLTQAVVEELAAEPALTLLSSRFEGFDERIVTHLASDAISIGPYVLSGGELPAMVLLDAIARRLPGALAEGSGEHESFSTELDGGLEYPHYTRPAEFRGWTVPEILLSGDHGRVDEWRREQSRERSEPDEEPRERLRALRLGARRLPAAVDPASAGAGQDRGERLHRPRAARRPGRGDRRRHRLGADLQVHGLRGRDRRLGNRLPDRLRRRARRRRPPLTRPAGDRDRDGAARRPARQVPRLRVRGPGGGAGLRHPDRAALGRDVLALPPQPERGVRALRPALDRARGRLGVVRAPARGDRGGAGAGADGDVAARVVPRAVRDAVGAGSRSRSRSGTRATPSTGSPAACRTAGA